MSTYVCVTCSSWFETMDKLKAHKKNKECLSVITARAAEKKILRAKQDAERKEKLSGAEVPQDKVEPTIVKEDVKVDIINNTENEVVTTQTDDEISIEDAENVGKEESTIEFSEEHVEAFKSFLVDECDVKVQKVSRAKFEKLKEGFGEFIPAFLEKLDN